MKSKGGGGGGRSRGKKFFVHDIIHDIFCTLIVVAHKVS